MVRWTAHAKGQLRHIHDYISQDSGFYATRVSEDMVKETVGLDELPRKGRKVPEINEDAVRELGIYSWRVIYEIKTDRCIDVLAIIHKRRHVEAEDISRGR